MRAGTIGLIVALLAPSSCGWLTDDCSEEVTCAGGVCTNACPAETNEEFCKRLEKDCGMVTAPDNRGVPRAAPCGSCPVGQLCTDAHVCK